MENLQTVIKNASRRMKIVNKSWISKGCNIEYIPKIYIYENGYIVGMYHKAAYPQLNDSEEKVYGKELGKHIVSSTFEYQVFNLKVEDIIEMVNRELNFVGYQNK